MEQVNYKYRTEPYQHQTDAIYKLYGQEYSALLMQQGTGKTKVAIDIASNLYLEGKINAVLLIAPNGVQVQWAKEQLPLHSPIGYKSFTWSTKKSRLFVRLMDEFMLDPLHNMLKWFCVNVEIFSTRNHIKTFREFVVNNKCMIIVDESTRIKNPGANRTINIMYNLAKILKKGRRVVGVEPYSKYRMILTGMMFTNSPYDLWSMFEFLKHDYFGCNYYAFKARYGLECKDTHPGTGRLFNRSLRFDEMESIRRYRNEGKVPEAIAYIMSTTESNVRYVLDHPKILAPYKNLEELRKKIDSVSFIIKKEDCLDLPPKIYEHIYVEMNSEQRRVYKELKQQFLTEYEDQQLTVQNKVSLVGRLQQITGGFFPYKDEYGKGKSVQITNSNPKLEALKHDLDETGREVIIVWARFVAELKTIHQALIKGFPDRVTSLYYGGTWKEDRSRIVEEFKKGNVDILVANARTAGIGLNLQRAHFQYFFSNSFSLEDRLQAEDRSHRSGQEYPVLYKDIIVTGTVDENVYQVLKAKQSLLEFFRSKSLAELIGG